jgi:hypothetical protein
MYQTTNQYGIFHRILWDTVGYYEIIVARMRCNAMRIYKWDIH